MRTCLILLLRRKRRCRHSIIDNKRRRTVFKNKLLAAALGLAFAVGAPAHAQEVYVPLISKGFQHQFWQAVKAGADQAGKDLKVKVTFEGPETEAMVDKQIDMLSPPWPRSRKPSALPPWTARPPSPC
jgi:ribose transport system substrate-binding protein